MRTATGVYRPYEILKRIRHCRLPGLSAAPPPAVIHRRRATAIDRILQKFIASLARARGVNSRSLPVPLSPSSVIRYRVACKPRFISSQGRHTRVRDVASFYLFARRAYRIFLPLPFPRFSGVLLGGERLVKRR